MFVFGGVRSAEAAAVRAGFNTTALAANDDDSTGLLPIGFTIDFFGTNYSNLYANNNGNVTFTGPMSTYTPFNLLSTATPIIAPFFGDVDTRGAGSDLLRYGAGTVGARAAWGATYAGAGVGYVGWQVDKLNEFQVVLIERFDTGAGNFDIEFNYDQMQWETGDASGGVGGLGGNSARVGYSNGVSAAYELPGSAVNGAFLDSNVPTGLINNSLNSGGVLGRYTFQARNGVVITPTVPVPAAAWMGLALLGALGVTGKLRRSMR